MRLQALLSVLITGACAIAGPPDDAVQTEMKKLEGTWVIESRRIHYDPENKETKRVKGLELKVIIEKDNWTDQVKTKAADTMTIKIDPKAKPKTIELSRISRSGRPEIRRGVYEIDG